MAVAAEKMIHFKDETPEDSEKTAEQQAFSEATKKADGIEKQIKDLLLESGSSTLTLEQRREKLAQAKRLREEDLAQAQEEVKQRLDEWSRAIREGMNTE